MPSDSDPVPVPVRKQRKRVLRELGAAKNRAFCEAMIGKTLSAVTLHEAGTTLTDSSNCY
jgi:tRNA A37 methylthiotransferase MiaB